MAKYVLVEIESDDSVEELANIVGYTVEAKLPLKVNTFVARMTENETFRID